MDNNAKIACCNICLLADRMKLCASCPLNPGNMVLKPSERELVQRRELLKPTKKEGK